MKHPRQRSFLTAGLWTAFALTLFWVAFDALADQWVLSLFNVGFLGAYGCLIGVRASVGHVRASQLLWAVVFVHIGGMAAALMGGQSDVHFYLLIVGFIPLLLIDQATHWRFNLCALFVSWALFALFQVAAIPVYQVASLDAGSERLATWFNVLFSLSMMGGMVALFLIDLIRAEQTAEQERKKADELLLNILPSDIAHRLKEGETRIADGYPVVSVLFGDLVGFTRLSAQLPPEELVEMLDGLVTRFDALASSHGVEKIKTIGDAYMAVGGLDGDNGAAQTASLARAMRGAVQDFADERALELSLRIGIHSGPVVAGIIGTNKFSYDIWGDTVNIASRMESHS